MLVEKIRDIVGLYVAPPERAIVLCVDEKSQIQALERTQQILPMTPGRIAMRTCDYRRHGTTSLFAALDVATGKVMGACMSRHRSHDFIRFLNQIDASTPADLDLHLVLDNYATHKTPAVKRWLARHARFHVHFTPTSGSWLNQVERWFAGLTDKALRRSVHRSVGELTLDSSVAPLDLVANGCCYRACPSTGPFSHRERPPRRFFHIRLPRQAG
jgi:transposase